MQFDLVGLQLSDGVIIGCVGCVEREYPPPFAFECIVNQARAPSRTIWYSARLARPLLCRSWTCLTRLFWVLVMGFMGWAWVALAQDVYDSDKGVMWQGYNSF